MKSVALGLAWGARRRGEHRGKTGVTADRDKVTIPLTELPRAIRYHPVVRTTIVS